MSSTFEKTSERMAPFWHKLPFFFGFPFRFGPLVFLGCLVAASALASLVLGAFGLLFKGFLVYLGLRYGFNVLELFARGRFEGESVDATLWGPEKRPAKLGLVLALFITGAAVLGNLAVNQRLANDSRAQDLVIRHYEATHAAALAEWRREAAAADALRRERAALAAARQVAAAPAAGSSPDDEASPDASPSSTASAGSSPAEADVEAGAHRLPSRAQMLQEARPEPFDALWFRLQPAWFWLVVTLASLLLPSAAMVIALDDAFFRSLNPLNVLRYVGAMGGTYFALWAFFLVIAGSRQVVLGAGRDWPVAVAFPIELGLATYLGLVLCALMGYVLYQHHDELGLDVEVDFDTHHRAGGAEGIARAGNAHAALRQKEPTDPFERRLKALLDAGDVPGAIAEVRNEMRYDRLDAPLNRRLHELLVRQGQPQAILEHGGQWLRSLARAKDGPGLLAALRELRRLDPAYEVSDGGVIAPAAAAALDRGDHATATGLLKGFDKRYPQHEDTPWVFFLAARLMSEHARQHDKAERLLQAIVARHASHAIAAEAQQYLTVLQRMAQGSGPGPGRPDGLPGR